MPKIKDKILWIAVILLGIYLLYRFIDLRKLTYIFPLDSTSDISAHMAMFYFLLKCGYHQACQYYNNMILFELYPPGWFFFIYPIYLFVKNIQFSTYISMILLYFIGFLSVFYFGSKFRFSILQKSLLFLFFFANPISIGNFLKLGRVTSLIGWIFALIIILFIINYKDKKIDYWFLVIGLFYAGVIFSHQPEALLSFFMIICLFMKKRELKEIFIIGLSLFIGLLISSVWWIGYLITSMKSNNSLWVTTERLLDFSGQWLITSLTSFVVICGFLFVSYFYFKNKKKDFWFFFPVLVLSILFVTRLIIFIPILNLIYPDEYMLFFILISGYLLFNLRLSKGWKNVFIAGILFVALISVIFSIYYTPFFKEHTDDDENVLSLLYDVEGKFVIFGMEGVSVYKYPVYCYANIYHDLNSVNLWFKTEIDKSYFDRLINLPSELKNRSCEEFSSNLEVSGVSSLISFNNYCDMLGKCGFELKKKSENACLYLI